MKKFILPVIALIIIGAGLGYYMYNKPVASLANKKPEVTVTAAQLLTDYETDETAANLSYHGKIIQVSGKVENITTEGGVKKIMLSTGSPMSSVICEIEDGAETGTLKAGDDVQIKGLCTGYLSDVIVVQSTVVR